MSDNLIGLDLLVNNKKINRIDTKKKEEEKKDKNEENDALLNVEIKKSFLNYLEYKIDKEKDNFCENNIQNNLFKEDEHIEKCIDNFINVLIEVIRFKFNMNNKPLSNE